MLGFESAEYYYPESSSRQLGTDSEEGHPDSLSASEPQFTGLPQQLPSFSRAAARPANQAATTTLPPTCARTHEKSSLLQRVQELYNARPLRQTAAQDDPDDQWLL
jgi:hypothetical protein